MNTEIKWDSKEYNNQPNALLEILAVGFDSLIEIFQQKESELDLGGAIY